ncbi:hypothetical protein JVX90_05515 [Gordonia sp. PDNC005]|uniref:hypothetical protein n=1 Tax=unclassified Gordonia (in: high G+C Gram-positive bacteria) TaxID=2657482 RepID=UPI00196509C6|nr:hypothetical protein [Gordonia sp. PDNC005]QRY63674.1 hypothetical protein JVX90_05515 [Gordonia sp. PDNC005]
MTDTSADLDDTIRLELEFLTSLVWAPATVAVAAVHAMIGRPEERDPPSRDLLPVDTVLFLRPVHTAVFAAVVARTDAGLPVTPTLLTEGIADPKERAGLRSVLLDIAAPSGAGPLPGGADVALLAVALTDHWYRRGYLSLLARMSLACEESATADLAGFWRGLTDHQQIAEARWLSVRQRLTRV